MAIAEAESRRLEYTNQGLRPPKSIRIGARRFRTEQNHLEANRILTSNLGLDPQIETQLITMRRLLEAYYFSLKSGEYKKTDSGLYDFVPNPTYTQDYAKLSLRQTWVKARLDGVTRQSALNRRVHELTERLHGEGNDWLLEEVTLKNGRRIERVPRYRVLVQELQASLR